jgi:hypothetical protein
MSHARDDSYPSSVGTQFRTSTFRVEVAVFPAVSVTRTVTLWVPFGYAVVPQYCVIVVAPVFQNHF